MSPPPLRPPSLPWVAIHRVVPKMCDMRIMLAPQAFSDIYSAAMAIAKDAAPALIRLTQ